ncbi:MAG: DUF192 domain-containing protein, partial [Treponema sp.]|nr:DUF192 domain-containing protein [Treponema sp.]
MRRNPGLSAALLLVVALQSCAAAGGEKPQGKLETTALVILRNDGTAAEVLAEITRSGEERRRGLMGRESLADGEGMLFVFETDQILSFWMKDTLIPLPIAFIAYDGRILEIHDMEPLSTRSVQSARSARYALEVPQGWFVSAGISPG